MKEVLLYRTIVSKESTLGHLMVFDVNSASGSKLIFECKSLELPPRDNMRNISAIPSGKYNMALEWSDRFEKELWELKDVPNRSEIKIHPANYYNELQGCISLGDMFIHLNADKFLDLRNSRSTVNRFHFIMGSQKKAIIKII